MARRMSSPDGSEVLTVGSEVGASVLSSLGWSTEGEAKSQRRSEPARPKDESESGETVSDEQQQQEQPGKRRPGRPRKYPVDEE